MLVVSLSFQRHGPHRDIHSFPTRRSSDLKAKKGEEATDRRAESYQRTAPRAGLTGCDQARWVRAGRVKSSGARRLDRKSTRLNSSHVAISYAVFCLKKKNYNDGYGPPLHQ